MVLNGLCNSWQSEVPMLEHFDPSTQTSVLKVREMLPQIAQKRCTPQERSFLYLFPATVQVIRLFHRAF